METLPASGTITLDGHVRSLDPRVRTVWSISRAVPLLVLGVGGAVAAGLADVPAAVPPLILVAAVLLAAWQLVWVQLLWRRWQWQVWEDAVELAYGVVARHASLVPFHRIQQIDIRRGPLERLMGLASLEVHTAAATSDALIPGIAAEQAESLRRALLQRAGKDDAA